MGRRPSILRREYTQETQSQRGLIGPHEKFFYRDPAVWQDGGTAVVFTGSTCEITPTNDYPGTQSVGTYDLTNKSARIRFNQTPMSANNTVSMGITLQLPDSANTAVIYADNRGLNASVNIAGTGSEVNGAPLQPWVRIRHDGANVLWESSADKVNWNVIRSIPVPGSFDVTKATINLYAGYWDNTDTGVTKAIFDNLNL